MSTNAARNIFGAGDGNFADIQFSNSLTNPNGTFSVDRAGNVQCQNLTAVFTVTCATLNTTTLNAVSGVFSGSCQATTYTSPGGFSVNSSGSVQAVNFRAYYPANPNLNYFAVGPISAPLFIADNIGKVTASGGYFSTNNSFTASAQGFVHFWRLANNGVGSGVANSFTVDPSGNTVLASLVNGTNTFIVDTAGNCSANTVSVWTGTGYINLQTEITSLQSQVSTLQSQVSTLQSQVSTLQSQVATLQSQVATLQSTPNTPLGWVVLQYNSGSNTLTQLGSSGNINWFWGVTLGGIAGTGQVGFVYTGAQTPKYFAMTNIAPDASTGAAPMMTTTQASATAISLFGTNVNWLVYTWNATGTAANASFSIFLY